MRGNWKRNAVIATMLVLMGTAVFLNWKYTDNTAASGTKILGESTLVSGREDAAASGSSSAGKAAGSAAGLSEDSVYSGSDYFASARLTRQQARDNAIELLQKAAAEEDADQSVANEASEGIQALASYTMTEAQIENLVTAKGYADCVAFMGDDSISVVVATDSGELTNTDVAKITDIAMTESGYPANSIKIMAAN
jgi:stage III sporulation protein AH